MKSLVLWSSRTGNTKAVAEAIFEALPGETEIMEEGREGNDLSSYDLVFVGFWGYRRGAGRSSGRSGWVRRAPAGQSIRR